MAGRNTDDLDGVIGDPDAIRAIFEQWPSAVCATEGPDHRIVAASAAFRAYTGRDRMIGAPLGETFADSVGRHFLPLFDQVLASGDQTAVRGFRGQLTRADTGEEIEFVLDVTLHPLRDPAGRTTGVLVDVTDVTARAREQQAAQRRTAGTELRPEQAQDVNTALQRELLPAGVPVLPRVQLSASYLPAGAGPAAGGDWFDALALPDGRVALVVGDVVGHGVAASAVMGQLRVLLRERLAATADLPAALSALDAAAPGIRGARSATVCVVLLDPGSGTLHYCTAGHPSPLLLTTGGEGRYLPPTGAGPVGAGGSFTASVVGEDELAAGELVLLYTDGILERPGRDLAGSTVELAEAAAAAAAGRAFRGGGVPADRVCLQTLELLTRATGHTDDITLLAAQLVTPPAPLRLPVVADRDSLASVRENVRAWLTAARVGRTDADAVLHAVAELATNVVDHAWIDSPDEHTFGITAGLTATGHVEFRVADRGRWREPAPSADRGLGLLMASNLVDELRVEHDEHGTTATVRHRVQRPARLLTAAGLPWATGSPAPQQPGLLLILDQPSAPSPRVRVDGPLDAATVTQFDLAIRAAGAAGTRDLTVDLTGVTHLASAGVSALHRLAALHRGNSTRLRWYAPPGTPADTVMSLVALPHDTTDPWSADE